jgi:hypothetical protein
MKQATETRQELTTGKRSPPGASVATCYVIVEGEFYSEEHTLCVCKTKKIALQKCRFDGFSYNRKDDLWSGERCGQSYYRRIEREDFYI